MASPFSIFRKHQKMMIATMAILAMGAFVFLDPLMGLIGGGGGQGVYSNPVVLQWSEGQLHRDELDQMVQMRRILNHFVVTAAQLGAMQGGGPAPTSNPSFGPATEQSVVQTMAFARAAEDAGFVVTDNEINRYLLEITGGDVEEERLRSILDSTYVGRNRKASMSMVFVALRHELLAQQFLRSYVAVADAVTPAERWANWIRLNDRVVVEVLPVHVETLAENIDPPSDSQLQTFFDKYKAREKQPVVIEGALLESPQPGFKVPRQVVINYLKAELAPFAEQIAPEISDTEIAEYYEQNKSQYARPQAPPETEPGETTQPGDPAETTETADPSEPAETSESAVPSEPAETAVPEKTDDAGTPDSDNKAGDPPPPDATDPVNETESNDEPAKSDDTPEPTEPENTNDTDPPPADNESNDEQGPDEQGPDEQASEEKGSEEQGCDEPEAAPDAEETSPTAEAGEQPEPADDANLEDAGAATEADVQNEAEEKNESDPPEAAAEPPATADPTPPAEEAEPAEPAAAAAETQPDDAAPADDAITSEAATEAPADDGADAPMSYMPLEEVQDEIRRILAEQKAPERMQTALQPLVSKMRRYYDELGLWIITREDAAEGEPAAERPAPPDLQAEAEAIGVAFEKTPAVSYFQLADTPLGKSVSLQRREALAGLAFSTLEPYEPTSSQDIDGNLYLAWKVEDQPAYIPKLADVRDQVTQEWKMQEARKPALERAEQLAKQARSAGEPLRETFPTDSEEADDSIVVSDPFSYNTFGDLPTGFRIPIRLSEVYGVDGAGPEFMDKVFALQVGEFGVAMNHAQTIAYVIRLAERQRPIEQLRDDFLRESALAEHLVRNANRQQLVVSLFDKLRESMQIEGFELLDSPVQRVR